MNMWDKELNEIQAKEVLKQFIDGLPIYINQCSMIAKSQKVYYDELVKEGFTEEQSLRITMAHGIYPGRIDRGQGDKDE
ncbi:hypothetical protein JMF89_17300 [Clostridiaceae bacterium UIB06]|nr:hypothetical protein [Clostridiaceae bacterium UIB06]